MLNMHPGPCWSSRPAQSQCQGRLGLRAWVPESGAEPDSEAAGSDPEFALPPPGDHGIQSARVVTVSSSEVGDCRCHGGSVRVLEPAVALTGPPRQPWRCTGCSALVESVTPRQWVGETPSHESVRHWQTRAQPSGRGIIESLPLRGSHRLSVPLARPSIFFGKSNSTIGFEWLTCWPAVVRNHYGSTIMHILLLKAVLELVLGQTRNRLVMANDSNVDILPDASIVMTHFIRFSYPASVPDFLRQCLAWLPARMS